MTSEGEAERDRLNHFGLRRVSEQNDHRDDQGDEEQPCRDDLDFRFVDSIVERSLSAKQIECSDAL